VKDFIPGLKLSEYFYHEAVRPILDQDFPQVAHSAGRLDFGSDVLGFDTPQSRDHGWGPKAMIFVSEADHSEHRQAILDAMSRKLPYEIRGYPTNYRDLDVDGGHLQPIDQGPVNHCVEVTTSERFFNAYLGLNPAQPIEEIGWFIVPQQRLRSVISGKILYDGLNCLESARQRLKWYPWDVWIYLLANQWRRIDQEEPFMARCGDVGDALGSRLVAARQVNEIMKLCFLMERQYAPYYKWFGTAFSRLDCAESLIPIFHQVFDSQDWKEREAQLSEAYLILAEMHNRLEITPHVEPEVSPFYGRPYQVPHSGRFVEALRDAIQSDTIRALPPYAGAVGQFVDSTDISDNLELFRRVGGVYSN
jgi:hypothetical protein